MTHAELQTAFDQHREAIYRFAWRMTNSAAAVEDIAQDVRGNGLESVPLDWSPDELD